MSMWWTPKWATASITAFWTAAGDPIVGASPMPFTPRGFLSVGVSWWILSIRGKSAAAGME